MSIRSLDISSHLIITTPSAGAITGGPRTVGILFKNLASSDSQVWYAYDASNFSQLNLYFDGDVWVAFQQWDANLDISTAIWRWLVISRGSTNPSAHRAHVATFTASGALSWTHADISGTRINYNPATRIGLGDEFGQGFKGDAAALVAYTSDLGDSGVEATFQRSSAALLASSPQFFAHFPFANGLGSPFNDLAGGGVETARSGSWSISADPTGYDFSLGRSGKPKVRVGSSWQAYPAKVWNGTSWETFPMKGYSSGEFIASK